MLNPGSMAIAASVAIHAGVAGLAVGHLARGAAPEQLTGWVDMELIAPPEPPPGAPLAPPPDAMAIETLHRTRREPPARARPVRHPEPGGTSSQSHTESGLDSAQPVAASSIVADPVRFVLPANSAFESRGPAPLIGDHAADSGGREQTLSANQVNVPARLLTSAPVVYPAAARAADVEANVAVEIVVDARGRVVDARTLAASGYGLDAAALRAVRAYRFSPAQRDGHAVRVRMRWNVLFCLR
jgi:TonB family protein